MNGDAGAKISESMRRYWAGLTSVEKEIRLRESFNSDESKMKSGNATKRFYASLTSEERDKRPRLRCTPEVALKISERLCAYYSSLSLNERKERARKLSEGLCRYWRNVSDEEKERWRLANSLSHIGRVFSSKTCEKISRSNTGRQKSREEKQLISLGMKKWWAELTPEERQLCLESSILSPEAKEKAIKSGRADTLRRFYSNLTEAERVERARRSFCSEHAILKSAQSNRKRPTGPELALQVYLDDEFPNQWSYNGDGREGLIVGGRIPDFININGRKVVIEVFGTYWHDEAEVEQRVNHYGKFGFRCIVFWDYECYLPERLRERLRR